MRFTTILQGTLTSVSLNRSLEIATAHGPFCFHYYADLRCKRLSQHPEREAFEPVTLSAAMEGAWVVARGSFCASSAGPLPDAIFELWIIGDGGGAPLADARWWCAKAEHIATFWLQLADKKEGGVFTNVIRPGIAPPGPLGEEKWSAMLSRYIAGMSFAFQLSGNSEFLEAAQSAFAFLKTKCVEWRGALPFFKARMLRDGRRHPESKNYFNIFEQEYSLTGPLRLYIATADPEVGEFCQAGLEALSCFHDREYGGFYDAISCDKLSPQKGETDTKSFTSGIDLVAAVASYAMDANLASANFSPRAVCQELISLTMRHHVVPGRPFIVESRNRDWSQNSSTWRNEYATPDMAGNIGASAKTARLLLALSSLFSDATSRKACELSRGLMDSLVSASAWDSLRGGVYDVMLRAPGHDGRRPLVYQSGFVWWTAQQFWIAAFALGLRENDRRLREIADSVERHYVSCFFSDEGAAFDTVDGEGYPTDHMVGRYVKSCLHELEYCYYAALLKAIAGGQTLKLHFASKTPSVVELGAITTTGAALWKVEGRESSKTDTIAVRYEPIPLS